MCDRLLNTPLSIRHLVKINYAFVEILGRGEGPFAPTSGTGDVHSNIVVATDFSKIGLFYTY